MQGVKPFDPYTNNGGSIVAIAGADYAVIATDSRLCNDVRRGPARKFNILTNEQSKLFRLSERAVLGTCGCWGDALTLNKVVASRLEMYYHDTNYTVMPTPAIAQMLSSVLYYKRFFPFYVANVLAGLTTEGKGCVYSFDSLGHLEETWFKAIGTAGALVQPLLDSKVGRKNMATEVKADASLLSKEQAMTILRDTFYDAAERDVCIGGFLYIHLITSDAITEHTISLNKD